MNNIEKLYLWNGQILDMEHGINTTFQTPYLPCFSLVLSMVESSMESGPSLSALSPSSSSSSSEEDEDVDPEDDEPSEDEERLSSSLSALRASSKKKKRRYLGSI